MAWLKICVAEIRIMLLFPAGHSYTSLVFMSQDSHDAFPGQSFSSTYLSKQTLIK